MSELSKSIFNRAELLFGEEGMAQIASKRVIIFGVGGVGSWCAESLVRTGFCHLTMVDCDTVCASNCNRQLMATTKTIGRVKVEALRERLLEINPEAEVEALCQLYTEENAASFHLENYDFIIDAIDSLKDKAHLILHACQLAHEHRHISFFSSMGAALRLDPTRVKADEFWNIKGDPLARALRNKFKKAKTFPARKFLCVYSEETPLQNVGQVLEQHDSGIVKAQVNGSLSHITGIFGMMLSGLVLSSLKLETRG